MDESFEEKLAQDAELPYRVIGKEIDAEGNLTGLETDEGFADEFSAHKHMKELRKANPDTMIYEVPEATETEEEPDTEEAE
jgi:hypothetical protein